MTNLSFSSLIGTKKLREEVLSSIDTGLIPKGSILDISKSFNAQNIAEITIKPIPAKDGTYFYVDKFHMIKYNDPQSLKEKYIHIPSGKTFGLDCIFESFLNLNPILVKKAGIKSTYYSYVNVYVVKDRFNALNNDTFKVWRLSKSLLRKIDNLYTTNVEESISDDFDKINAFDPNKPKDCVNFNVQKKAQFWSFDSTSFCKIGTEIANKMQKAISFNKSKFIDLSEINNPKNYNKEDVVEKIKEVINILEELYPNIPIVKAG